MSDRYDDDVYERTADGRFRKRGYPVVPMDHPLWQAQRNRWDGYTREEAWREAVRGMKISRADSKLHPAYAPDFLVNDEQAREIADAQRHNPAKRPGESVRREIPRR